jgi:hypothetical protein
MVRLFALALVGIALPATAQVQFSARGGFTAASLHVVEDDLGGLLDFEERFGLTAAVGAEYPFSRTLALRTELAYAMKGATRQADLEEVSEGNAYDLSFDLDYAFDYVELPVLLEFVEPTPYVRLALFAGPTFSLNVRERVDVAVTGTINGQPITDEQAEMLAGLSPDDRWVKGTDVGVTLGWRAVRGPLYLDARFTLGLPVASDRDEDTGGFVEVKNRAFAASVGYTF